jgi:hypothetical protein
VEELKGRWEELLRGPFYLEYRPKKELPSEGHSGPVWALPNTIRRRVAFLDVDDYLLLKYFFFGRSNV